MDIVDGGIGHCFTNIFIESNKPGLEVDTHFTFTIDQYEANPSETSNSIYVAHEWVQIPAIANEVVHFMFTVTSVRKIHLQD